MPQITQAGRVMVPVSDQDEAIAFSTGTLGFSLLADVPRAPITPSWRRRASTSTRS